MPKEPFSDLLEEAKPKINPWAWISTLYFAEGIPYVIVMVVSTIMYKNLGISNSDIAFYTSWLYLPWVIKFAWSPFVDILKTKRFWIIVMQLILGVGFAGVALTLPADNFFRYSLAFLWLLAFSSATHDIAADGFYMLALREDQQAFFVGIRSTFYRIAMITGQGLLVVLAGYLEEQINLVRAWQITMGVSGALMIFLYLYHSAILPKVEDEPEEKTSFKEILNELVKVLVKFFQKKQILLIIVFILLYRLGEAQLGKIAAPFLLDSVDAGGLGISTKEVGLIYGTIGVIALVAGGIIGGILASRDGLKAWIWWM
ncbi:MAG: MFS transporter, partial [Bacteroidetes bacterium]|nr:MFS transporter [Bacteroidota bacterium]